MTSSSSPRKAGNKKVVKAAPRERADGRPDGAADTAERPTWRPTPEAKSAATRNRIVAAVLWFVAFSLQMFAIFGLLNSESRARIGLRFGWDAGDEGFPTWALVTLVVLFLVIGVLAVVGSLLWKKANDLDPASEDDTVRYFVQNQLGAIVTLACFLPLVVLVLLNKDMDQKQKTIAGSVGAVVMIAAVLIGVDWQPTSVEQRTVETQWDQQRVIEMTGQDQVYWVPGGSVYHLCAEVSPLQVGSTSEEIYEGTVQDAVDAGMERLTKQVQMEINQCGLEQPDDRYLDWTPPDDL